jgi:transcriptional regulator of acetoin/glycerol metabolism
LRYKTAQMGETHDDSTTRSAPARGARRTFLAVVLECDRPLAGGARYCLDGIDEVTIGRGDERRAVRRREAGGTKLHLEVPGASMSAKHARLRRAGLDWVLDDAGSRNGSFVDGARTEHAVLAEGALFELGHTFFQVFSALASGAAPDLDASSPAGTTATLDPSFAHDLAALDLIAASTVSILVRGESGAGKEVLARGLHAASKRKGPFVAVNCGALPVGLVESQLFGHVKGAFSGALRDQPGLFRAADGGTLFLDEIADLPSSAQAALLRALQEREVLPVGGTRPIGVDVRFVAATHQPLEAMVAAGTFRTDLLARIAGFSITLPPLRARRVDLGILVAALLRDLAPASAPRFSADAGLALLSYGWPLNVRELQQALAVGLALAHGADVERAHLPAAIAAPPVAAAEPRVEGRLTARDERLRAALLAELAARDGNLADVARAMGKARMQVHRWCKRFGIDPNAYRR